VGSGWFYKHVMVVEENIDIHDPAALDWAMAYRVNAGLGGIAFYGPTLGSSLDLSTPPEKANMANYGSGERTRCSSTPPGAGSSSRARSGRLKSRSARTGGTGAGLQPPPEFQRIAQQVVRTAG
jgi:hypothetical protein